MRKLIVIVGVAVAIIGLILIGLRIYTKSFSPQDIVSFEKEEVNITIQYGRPYKKDRVIFGGLVPYGEVWRTGANEPTVMTTNTDLKIGNEILPKGSYAIFTIPNKDKWIIIFNKNIPSWGVDFSAKANNDPEGVVLQVEVASIDTKDMFEQFTITFEQMHDEIDLVLMWDQTLVVLPMIPAK